MAQKAPSLFDWKLVQPALWDSVKSWFEGGAPASGAINAQQAVVHNFPGGGGATWRIYLPSTPKEQKAPVAWESMDTPVALDPNTFGYRWNFEHVHKTESKDGALAGRVFARRISKE
jgi:hypothetical protein